MSHHQHKDKQVRQSQYMHTPTEPLRIEHSDTISDVLRKMTHTGFQGRQLGQAADVWTQMIEDEKCTIFLGLAGALVPAGMRRLLVWLIENRMLDVLVSTGANLFHDLHESLGRFHFQSSSSVDDVDLAREMIDRMYDILASEREFREHDAWVGRWSGTLERGRPYTTREFLHLLGKEVATVAVEDGILTAAYRHGVPIYVPALGDSSYGIALAAARQAGISQIQFDIVRDVVETAEIAYRSGRTGVIYLGGGTPKNFINQTEVTASVFGEDVHGHTYALQVTADAPHWGGLSGCTFEEAQSWGKIAPQARMVTVHADTTIALPLLATALAQRRRGKVRRAPQFSWKDETLTIKRTAATKA